MNSQHSPTLSLLIAIISLAATSPSHAVPTEYQDSSAFAYRYEFGDVDPANPAQIDLDGNGLADLRSWQSPTLNPTAGTVEFNPSDPYSDAYLSVDPELGSIWHNTEIDVNSGYTIEFRAKAGHPLGENIYSSSVFATANSASNEFWLTYGPNGQAWGSGGELALGENVNDDDFHTFRVVSEPGGNDYWVWRDGQLLNPGMVALPETAQYTPRMGFGGVSSSSLGSTDYDYFRFTAGAYLPPGADPLPPPIEVTRELYVAHPGPGRGADLILFENAPGVYEERVTFPSGSDPYGAGYSRRTNDNGKTWSVPGPIESPFHYEWDEASQTDIRVFWDTYARVYDPEHERTVSIWLRQSRMNPVCCDYPNHSFARSSDDLGLTWNEPTMLRYEPGDDFDPNDPFKPGFLDNNTGYFPSSIIRHSNGTILAPLGIVNDPGNPGSQQSGIIFIGQWDEPKGDYTWAAGDRVTIPPEFSWTGLDEPDIAELSDGRVLVVWRTSATAVNPGRKWFTVSDDGGQTLGDVQEMKYDDGTSFYSPASFSRMIRHSVTGKLYWIGNITEEPPSGNLPRYPLVIAEINEENLTLDRDSVTIVDDLLPGDSTNIQLTNFPIVENPETHEFELYLYRIGADPTDFWGNDLFKYTISFSNVLLPDDADFDEDGDVDGNDLVKWEAGFGSTSAAHMDGDADTDGDTDGYDFLIWQTQFGSGAAPFVDSQAVPEPASSLLLILGGFFCAQVRRRQVQAHFQSHGELASPSSTSTAFVPRGQQCVDTRGS